MKRWADYIDDWGFICKIQSDGSLEGGDTLANEATFWLFSDITVMPPRLAFCEVDPGVWVRHPHESGWTSDPEYTSGDQVRSMLTACIVKGETIAPRRFCLAHSKRGFLFMGNVRRNGSTPKNHGEVYEYENGQPVRRNYNWKPGDFTGPEFWALLIRATRNEKKKWLLNYLDYATYKTAQYYQKKPPGDDIRNRLQVTIASTEVWPTKYSLKAKAMYSREFFTDRMHRFWGDDLFEPPMDQHILKSEIFNRHFPLR